MVAHSVLWRPARSVSLTVMTTNVMYNPKRISAQPTTKREKTDNKQLLTARALGFRV